MFLCALARPQYNYTTRKQFDGLIGIYPVGELHMYVRTSSTHRPGDIKWSNVNMDRDLYQKMLVDLVLPDIKKKMPVNTNIILQQDGAKSHLQADDEVFKAKVTELYGDPNAVKLYTQLAQSPDLNVNDLGFFSSLQSKYYMTSPKDSMVEQAYKKSLWPSLNRIWLTQQIIMSMIIEERGDNKFKIPHMNKDMLETMDELPVSIVVTPEANN
jgi:hypothetical protein